jgi:4-amino-4-deoxy-L-arabinose transferase-like glycosyltransferase
MLSTKVYQFQYDLGIQNISNENVNYDIFFNLDRNYVKENGNMEYLIRIYQTGKLLDSNTNQAYHPPLHHYISAGVMRICDLFGASNEFKLESAEFPAFVYSILIMVVVYQITKELNFKDTTKILVMLMVALNPLLIYLSKLINNDPLVTLFIIASVLYLIRWYKNPNMKWTCLLALSIGLGASTKTSIVVMFAPLIVTYIMKLYMSVDDSKLVKKIILYGIVFSIISLPLVLWYPIRNAIKFNQPPFGVLSASSELAVEKTDFVNRWLINSEIFANKLELKASNVISYAINSSIIFIMNADFLANWLVHLMRILSIALIAIAIISIIKNSDKNFLNIILITTVIIWFLSFIGFNMSLPYSCTMHSRYIVIVMVIGMLYIAKLFEQTNKKWLKNTINVLVVLYSLGTVGIFTQILTSLI